MALGLSIALAVVVMAAIAVPSWRLGKRLVTPPGERKAALEDDAQRKRKRAEIRKAELAALKTRERVMFYAYYAISLSTVPVGLPLTIYGHGTTRTVGLVLLLVAVLLMAVPVGPILGARARRRKRASSDR